MGYRLEKVGKYDATWHVMTHIRTGPSLIWEWPGRNDNHGVNTNLCITYPICFFHLINIFKAPYMPGIV